MQNCGPKASATLSGQAPNYAYLDLEASSLALSRGANSGQGFSYKYVLEEKDSAKS